MPSKGFSIRLAFLIFFLDSGFRLPVRGFFYTIISIAFVFMDVLKVKSRVLLIAIGVIFVLANMNEIYRRTFGDSDQGVVLFKYTIQSKEYKFMKRSTKRYLYLQIMLFSINAIYMLLKDKKMEFLAFATGCIYRETGTASKNVESKSFVQKIKLETV